jgi:hypothetical protein
MMLSTIQPIGSRPVKPPSSAALPANSVGMPYAKIATTSAASRPSPAATCALQMQEAEADQHHDDRQRRQCSRDDHAAERVVVLLPDHGVLLLLTVAPAPGDGSAITVSVRIPCAPRIRTPSMSAVADGPVMSTA